MAGTQPGAGGGGGAAAAAAPADLKAYYGGRYFKGAAEGDFEATGPSGNVGNPPKAFDPHTMSDVPAEEPVVEEASVVEPEPVAEAKPKAPARRKASS